MSIDAKGEAILKLARNRPLAHAALFRHRHPDATPDFHTNVITDWHSPIPRLITLAFREGGKSTIAEEGLILGGAFKLFRNCILLGENSDRANDRLRAIKHEYDTNEMLSELFGELHGSLWNEGKVVLANGVCFQAFGRGQALRGVKHLDARPDYCFADDLEDEEHVRTPEARHETLTWFMKVVIPALDKRARIRLNATPLDPQALPMVLSKQSTWTTRTYPIEYVDDKGERQPTWPARYPLPWIDGRKKEFYDLGLAAEYQREYMCVAEDPAKKIFTASMFKTEPKVRTWQPTFAMYDPARTTNATSASTGWAVWSWIANRMIVWDAGAELWKPDELVNHIFKVNADWSPVLIGVEKDGLDEFVMQPIRHEMVKRGVVVPIVPVAAPKGKIKFIEGLQPFFLSGEVTFAKDLPIVVAQFLSFPTGRIDAPNALAYAPRMRPGIVIYENFGAANVVDDLPKDNRAPFYLCLNATSGCTTGVLLQMVNGALHVIADYVYEGDPGAVVGDIVRAAQLDASKPVRMVAGVAHFGAFDRIGLRGAVAKLPAELQRGGAEGVGRDELRALLQKQVRQLPALLVSTQAWWTINAFSAGYARAIDKKGGIQGEARDGIYKTLMEGLEAFSALLKIGIDEQSDLNVAYTPGGQRFVSALPRR